MLATFGLQRLESSLDDDAVSASDVAEFLEQAEAGDVNTLAREGMGRALDGLHRRVGGRGWAPGTRTAHPDMKKFSKPLGGGPPAQTQFLPTRQAKPVLRGVVALG